MLLAFALLLAQEAGRLQAVVDRACDLDPVVRADAAKEAIRLAATIPESGSVPARIVLALAGKHDPAALLRLSERSARQVACDLLTPTKEQLPDVLKLLEAKDRGVRIAAGRALGRVEDPVLRRTISSALGHGMRRTNSDDVLFALIASAWQGNASSHLFHIADADPERAGLALAALCNVPSLVVTEGFAPSLLRALENGKIERPLRSLLIRVVGRGSPWALCPLLAVRDRELRAEIVETLDRTLVDPLAAPALHAAGRGKLLDPTLLPWIEQRLKMLCGDDVTLENFPKWAQANVPKLVEKQADAAVSKGAAGLLRLTERSASWKSSPGGLAGLSAFAAYALLQSGIAPDDPGLARCLDAVLDRDPQGIYATSLSALALAAAVEKGAPRRERLERRLQGIADVLVASQLKSGGWSYVALVGFDQTTAGWSYDLSNTQFAILGLRAAANAGAKIPRSTWERALHLLEKAQLEDGGWTYQGKDGPSYPRMTAAGASSWILCRISLDEKLAPATAADSFRIRNATSWLARATDPARMPALPDFYLLYSVERLCMIAGIGTLGGRDWYAEGASILIRSQGPDGVWRGSHGAVADTCMALLFLRKAFVARPDIPTETARRRVTPEQIYEQRLESFLAEGVKEVRVERDSLLLLVESDAEAKRLAELLGVEIDGVPLRFKVRE